MTSSLWRDGSAIPVRHVTTDGVANDLRYGYQVAGGPLTLVGVKPVGCTGPQGVPTSGATIGPFKTNTTFRVFLIDHSCPNLAANDTGPGTTYYSDHTSTSANPSADH